MRYIDADKVMEEINRIGGHNLCEWETLGVKALIDRQPTADVVPKSEVDNWYQLYHSIKEELKQEKIYHGETEKLCDRYCIESQQAKKQVAREIFEEIETCMKDFEDDDDGYLLKKCEFEFFMRELKKKYIPQEKVKTEDKPLKYFTPEDVRRMTAKDVADNYKAIMESMKRWK